MNEKRISILLSVAAFLQLMFLGFAGSFVSEIIKEQQNNLILFWSSFFALILAIPIVYIYLEVFALAGL